MYVTGVSLMGKNFFVLSYACNSALRSDLSRGWLVVTLNLTFVADSYPDWGSVFRVHKKQFKRSRNCVLIMYSA